MSIFHDKFSTGHVTVASGVSNATLQSWLKRGVVIGQNQGNEIEGGGSPGVHRRFSFYSIMQIAIVKALGDAGLTDLTKAFAAAAHFSHTGDPNSSQRREPSLPFEKKQHGVTLLCVGSAATKVVFYQVGKDIIPDVVYSVSQDFSAFIIGIDPIFDRVTSALGYHPEDVLNLAYGQ